MPTVVFVLLLLFYGLHSVKVVQFSTIFALGFKIETSRAFLEHRGLYMLSRWALFLAVAISAFVTKWPPWYGGIAMLLLLSFVASIIGCRLAFNSWRRIHAYLAQDETDPDELASLQAGAHMADSELRARLAATKRHAI